LQTKNDAIISLLKIHKKLSFTHNLMNVLASISKEATHLLNGDRATIYVYDKEKDALISYVASKLEIDEIFLKKGEGIAGKVAETKKSMVVNNTENNKDFNPFFDSQTSYKTINLITSPLLNRAGDLVGVIQVLNKKDGSFQIDDLKILEILASVSAIALEQAQLSYQNQILKDYNRLLIQNFNAGLLVLDSKFFIQDYNAYFSNLFQLPDEVQEQSLSTVCPEIYKILLSSKNKDIVQFQNQKGCFFQITVSDFLFEEKEKMGKLVLISDVTQKVKEDKEKELEERMSMLGRMSNQILHDIKSPLFIIRGYTSLLAITEEKKEQKRYLDIMGKEVTRILETIQETLEFSRGEVEILAESLLVSQFHQFLLDLIDRNQKGLGITMNCILFPQHENSLLTLDLKKLERALQNILLNAVEASPNIEKACVEIETYIKDSSLSILIKDKGVGIPLEQAENIFNPFATYNKKHGTGLGLAIAKVIVEKHKGSLHLTKKEGWSTCLEITLPIKLK